VSVQVVEPEGGCVMLPWDSEFFGRRIARFEGARFTRADGDAATRFCTEHAIDCLYILLDASDTASIATVQEYGARFVDLRMTFEAVLEEPVDSGAAHAMPCEVRAATERDLPAMRRIAAISYHDTRFYADARFDADRADLLYQTWIEKSCHGYADAVLVIEAAGEAAGYVTCHLDDGVTGRIGLIAVRPDLQGRGAAVCLLRAARNWFITAGCRSWKVTTQGSNVPASRRYQACGFRTAAVQIWFHLWPAEAARGRL
jgi:dTDP-4-amino-4,6-dideoxy-D-galactose acyltransferase